MALEETVCVANTNLSPLVPQPVCDPVALDGLEPLELQHALAVPVGHRAGQGRSVQGSTESGRAPHGSEGQRSAGQHSERQSSAVQHMAESQVTGRHSAGQGIHIILLGGK